MLLAEDSPSNPKSILRHLIHQSLVTPSHTCHWASIILLAEQLVVDNSPVHHDNENDEAPVENGSRRIWCDREEHEDE